MSSSEPCSRKYFFSFNRHSSVYVWGGVDDRVYPVDDLNYLYEFNYATLVWARHQLKDQHPPGVSDGCCARIGDCVYFYGGVDESRKETGSLYGLNLTTLTWQKLSSPGPSSPSKKCGGRMIQRNNTLVIHGGVTRGGRRTKESRGGRRTNETHIFDIATGTWSSPEVTGDVPKPDHYFVFCKVSHNKVVRCGGESDRAIRVLDLSRMHWTKLHQSEPHLGVSPIATCIGYGSDHAQLLIIGYNGVWLLDVATLELKELQDTDLLPGGKYLKRWGHSVTMLSSTPTSVEILIFGGQTYDGLTWITLSSTILLILKKNEDNKWWRITDIIKGDELKERTISYLSDPFNVEKESAAEVQHVDEVKVDTDKKVEDESQFNNESSTQEEADSVSIPSQASQTGPSQSSQASSQSASSKPILHENTEFKKTSEDQLTPEKVNFSSDVTAAILNKQNIRRKVANLLLKGLPGSGKTSLLDRLLNEPFRANCPSTGLCEKVVTVEIRPSSTHISVYTGEDNSWKVTNFDESIVSQLDACKVFISYDTTKNPQRHLQQHEARALKLDHPVSAIEHHIKEVLCKHNINNIVDLQTKNSLYIRDTGGQVEFQESLSLLIFGPSIFIFVLRADVDIHTKNIIQYRKPNGETINKYKSSISTLDALIQFLTSVSAIQTTEAGVFQEDGTSVCHKPIVFIVGTHIDQIGSEADSILSNINKMLHEMIFQRNYLGLIRYADFNLKKVMYQVDNTCREDNQCQQLRSDISKFIQDRDEYFVVYPVSYLLFCLELQNINEIVLSMDDCKKLAAKFYIEEKEILSLLKFLHFRVGIIHHYNVEGISDVVIKEPQVLFNKVTDLILQTFLSSGSVSGEEHEIFMKKGILEASAFTNILSNKDKMTAEQFLLFLLHLRVAVPFTDEDGVKKYIIPSVLNHVQKSSSDAVYTDIAPLAITFKLGHCPQGLLGMLISYLLNPEEDDQELTFDLLVDHIYQDQVSLRVNSSEETDQICLKSCLTHLEVSIVFDNCITSSTSKVKRVSRESTPNEICCNVRQTIHSSLELSLKKLHYNYSKIKPSFCLVCPEEECLQLHEVKKGKKSWYMRCSTHNSKLALPESGLCWFEEESITTPFNDSSKTQTSSDVSTQESNQPLPSPQLHSCDTSISEVKPSPVDLVSFHEEPKKKLPSASSNTSKVPEFSLKNLTSWKWCDKDGKSHFLRLRNEMNSNWRDIGVLLELSPSRLKGMKKENLGDDIACCDDVLQVWLENGSSDYPASWEGLLDLLEGVELNSLKNTLEDVLKNY